MRKLRRRFSLRPPGLQKTEVPASVEDDVIQECDSHDLTSGLELLCHFNIGRSGLKAVRDVLLKRQL